jgi:FlaA1/EpsC-like NDP-sugar epimerase
MNILELIGRNKPLFEEDLSVFGGQLKEKVKGASFLVLGGAGSIGQAVVKEIFKRHPRKLYVVDISENNLVELVRDVRSSMGYIKGDFQTFALDIRSTEYQAFSKWAGNFDYVLNLSALKHVRSEKDPFTLMRMIEVNVLNTIETIAHARQAGAAKYFCVSTDKAANPVNMMGASKRIMEQFLMQESNTIAISTARFANVAFSDGSLLHGFNQRLLKQQPIVAPNDIKRYFVTPEESGVLCSMSCLLGNNREIFFPKLSDELHLITFSEIAEKYLKARGYEPYLCNDEEEARALATELPAKGKWPCLFSVSDTTGEKDFEEFFVDGEELDMERFPNLGIVKNTHTQSDALLKEFLTETHRMREALHWTKEDLVELFHRMIPSFGHKETGKYLDSKM